MTHALIIDDDAHSEIVLRDYFKRLGVAPETSCTFARSDEDALAIIQSGAEFDIALVAVDREPISGLGLFHQITDNTFRVPRIALSSGADLGLIRRAMNEGAADFMVKPLEFSDFEATLLRVIETVERRRKNWREGVEYSALKKEIDIAADIQQRILPLQFPNAEDYEIYADMRPARVMGGDFFDIFEFDNSDIGFIVADVSGKGVPAAFYMAVARTLIHSAAFTISDPAGCLAQVNRLLCDHHIPGMFVSVFYGRIDAKSHRMTFANAGHQLPFKVGPDKMPEQLEGGHGVVLGIIPDLEYLQDEVTLEPGEFLFVFTDGITEAFNSNRQAFGEKRLADCLQSLTSETASEVIDQVSHAINDFVGEADQHDDITSLVIKRK